MSDEKNHMLFFPSSFFFFRLIDYFHWNLNVKKIQGCCTDYSWEQNKKNTTLPITNFSISLSESSQWYFTVSGITFPNETRRRKRPVVTYVVPTTSVLLGWDYVRMRYFLRLQSGFLLLLFVYLFALSDDKCLLSLEKAQQNTQITWPNTIHSKNINSQSPELHKLYRDSVKTIYFSRIWNRICRIF